LRTIHTVWNESESLDRRLVLLISEHIDLLLAVTAWGIALWAVFTGHFEYVPALAAAGAVSFFVGFIPSLTISAVMEALFLIGQIRQHHSWQAAITMVEIFGYGCVAWLGFRHREQQRLQKEMAMKSSHDDSVMPWAVTNEVRTSLAAIRFLLFPLHAVEMKDEAANAPLRQATEELQRLEQLFSEMEKSNKTDTDPPQNTGIRPVPSHSARKIH
jgi:hypothetical protein